MGMLEKLCSDMESKVIFRDVLRGLIHLVEPGVYDIPGDDIDYAKLSAEQNEQIFQTHLFALTNLQRKMTIPEGNVKIGYWCSRDIEKHAKGMDGWPIYWVKIRYYSPVPVGPGLAVSSSEITFSVWVEGKDDNCIQKALRVWVATHFGKGQLVDIKCVRR